MKIVVLVFYMSLLFLFTEIVPVSAEIEHSDKRPLNAQEWPLTPDDSWQFIYQTIADIEQYTQQNELSETKIQAQNLVIAIRALQNQSRLNIQIDPSNHKANLAKALVSAVNLAKALEKGQPQESMHLLKRLKHDLDIRNEGLYYE